MKPPSKGTPPTKARKAKVPPASAAPMPGMAHDEMRFRAEDALRTLHRADEIKADPHLMGHVKAHAREQRNHLSKIIRRKG